MSKPNENRAPDWFTPLRFGLLLALLIFAMFPQVVLGLETFVARDFGFFAYPLAHFQRDCFWRGEIPFWNPYNDCGVPFLAQWNTMPLYPPSLIYLTLPLEWSLGFFCLMHLWFAGLGMFFLARKWTGNNFAAAFAGVAFSFNGFTLNLLMWPSHIATFAWMPWVIFAVEVAWRDGGRKIIPAAVVGALQMLAGGPETIFLTWTLLLVLWLQQFLKGECSRPAMLWRFPLMVLMVMALTAAQLLPFLDLVAHSQRETGYADLRWSMPGWGWANFLVPLAFGSTHTEGIFFQEGQFWTSSYYLGIATLWLALLAVWKIRDRRVWLLGILIVIALFFALGENTFVYPALRKILPQLSFITYPVKYVAVMAFLSPLLAAFAVANLPAVKNRIAIVGIILFSLLATILFCAWRFPFPTDDVPGTLHNGFSRAIFLVVIGWLLFVLTRQALPGWRRMTPLLLISIAWLDVFTHEPTQNPTVPSNVYEPNLARAKLAMQPQPELGQSRAMITPKAYLQLIYSSIQNPKNNFLAKRLGYTGDGNLLDLTPKVDGFFSLYPREIGELLRQLYTETDVDYPRLDDFMAVSQMTAPDEFFHWELRRTFLPFVTSGQKPVFLDEEKTFQVLTQSNFDGSKIVFLSPETKSFVTVSHQTPATILGSTFANQTVDIAVEAAEPSLVVIAQTYYHNWHAEIDGQPTKLFRANVAFQAVQVPIGRHKIHLFYQDRVFETGAAISIIAWLGCFIGLFRLPYKKNG